MLTFQFSVLVWLKRELYRIKFNGRLNKRDTVVQSTLCLNMMMVVLFICTHLHALHLEASWVCASLCIVISERFLFTYSPLQLIWKSGTLPSVYLLHRLCGYFFSLLEYKYRTNNIQLYILFTRNLEKVDFNTFAAYKLIKPQKNILQVGNCVNLQLLFEHASLEQDLNEHFKSTLK